MRYIAPLWTVRLVDRPVHSDEHLLPGYVVSDGTRQRDGTIAFAGCAAGGLGWVGRVHLPGTSYESEVAGLLQGLVAIEEHGMGSVPVSDCRSALYAVRRTLRRRPSASRSCLMTAAPLYCVASERLGEGGMWEEMDWTWTRAHTDASEIILGTLTALQD